MTYPYVQAWYDYGPRKGPLLGLMLHMAEGGGTVSYLDNKGDPPKLGNSSHAVCEYSGRIVQMLPWDHAAGSLNPADRSTDKGYYSHQHLVDVLGDWWTDPNSAVIALEIEGFAAQGPNPQQKAGIIIWASDMAHRFPTLRGALGHADQTDKKACPGSTLNMRAVFTSIGGHGLWTPEDAEVAQLPITSEIPMEVQAITQRRFYELDGKTVVGGADNGFDWRLSPYAAGTFRAIYSTIDGKRRTVLVHADPDEIRPLPPTGDYQTGYDAAKAAAVVAVEGI